MKQFIFNQKLINFLLKKQKQAAFLLSRSLHTDLSPFLISNIFLPAVFFVSPPHHSVYTVETDWKVWKSQDISSFWITHIWSKINNHVTDFRFSSGVMLTWKSEPTGFYAPFLRHMNWITVYEWAAGPVFLIKWLLSVQWKKGLRLLFRLRWKYSLIKCLLYACLHRSLFHINIWSSLLVTFNSLPFSDQFCRPQKSKQHRLSDFGTVCRLFALSSPIRMCLSIPSVMCTITHVCVCVNASDWFTW